MSDGDNFINFDLIAEETCGRKMDWGWCVPKLNFDFTAKSATTIPFRIQAMP